jgi:hypothetical protein
MVELSALCMAGVILTPMNFGPMLVGIILGVVHRPPRGARGVAIRFRYAHEGRRPWDRDVSCIYWGAVRRRHHLGSPHPGETRSVFTSSTAIRWPRRAVLAAPRPAFTFVRRRVGGRW